MKRSAIHHRVQLSGQTQLVGQPTNESPQSIPGKETFSQFLAKVLDQLSLSAWLPSAAMVGGFSLIVLLRLNDGSFPKTGEDLAQVSVSTGLIVVSLVVVGTMATQAFTFESIRVLEGYWGGSHVGLFVSRVRCDRHVKRRTNLEDQIECLQRDALEEAMPDLEEHFGWQTAELIAKIAQGHDPGTSWRPAIRRRLATARSVPWEEYANLHTVRRLHDLENQLNWIPPVDARVLPTRLGNILRAHEDRANPPEQNVESFVISRWDQLSDSIRHEHDQLRNQLDLYCTMVFVSVILGVFGVTLFATSAHWTWAWVGIVAAVLTFISWKGSLAAARGYGPMLELIASVAPAIPNAAG